MYILIYAAYQLRYHVLKYGTQVSSAVDRNRNGNRDVFCTYRKKNYIFRMRIRIWWFILQNFSQTVR